MENENQIIEEIEKNVASEPEKPEKKAASGKAPAEAPKKPAGKKRSKKRRRRARRIALAVTLSVAVLLLVGIGVAAFITGHQISTSETALPGVSALLSYMLSSSISRMFPSASSRTSTTWMP